MNIQESIDQQEAERHREIAESLRILADRVESGGRTALMSHSMCRLKDEQIESYILQISTNEAPIANPATMLDALDVLNDHAKKIFRVLNPEVK